MSEKNTNRPYTPSWIDRLTDWIDELPIPVWAFYLIIYLLCAISLHLSSWIDVARPWGELSPVQFYTAIWLPLVLGIIHNTDRVAANAFDRFAPLVRNKVSEMENLRYKITTMPARPVLWMSIIISIILLISAIQDPEFVVLEIGDGPIHPLSWVLSTIIGVTSYSFAPAMIYHAVRQLNFVTKAYALIDEVNIFHQQPMYAFSGFTMRTALFLVSLVYITYLGEFFYEASSAEATINVLLSSIIIPLSLVIVLLPLWGIHQRLSDAKGAVLEENSLQIAEVRNNLYQEITAQNYKDVQGIDSAMESLYKERGQLKSIPTWPWAPGMFRSFLSAILVPMLLWALQVGFSRFIG